VSRNGKWLSCGISTVNLRAGFKLLAVVRTVLAVISSVDQHMNMSSMYLLRRKLLSKGAFIPSSR